MNYGTGGGMGRRKRTLYGTVSGHRLCVPCCKQTMRGSNPRPVPYLIIRREPDGEFKKILGNVLHGNAMFVGIVGFMTGITGSKKE
jgi:hypothetical protein